MYHIRNNKQLLLEALKKDNKDMVVLLCKFIENVDYCEVANISIKYKYNSIAIWALEKAGLGIKLNSLSKKSKHKLLSTAISSHNEDMTEFLLVNHNIIPSIDHLELATVGISKLRILKLLLGYERIIKDDLYKTLCQTIQCGDDDAFDLIFPLIKDNLIGCYQHLPILKIRLLCCKKNKYIKSIVASIL